jgi:hypothetical protein
MGRGRTPITRSQQRVLREEQQNLEGYRRRQRKQQRSERQHTYRSDGVTRCSRCPPTSCCNYCAGLNNARQQAGLIRPRGDPTPHPNNRLIPVVSGTLKGGRPLRLKHIPYPVIAAYVRPLGGGWRVGVASLDGKEVYVSKPMRSVVEAMTYANERKALIRIGLEYEAETLC